MRRFTIFVAVVIIMAIITINLPVKPSNADTKVDVYDRNKLVKSVVFAIGVNQYYVNGKTPGTMMDARPFIKDGRTFVPVRFLGNALGVTDDNINWDNNQKKAALLLGQNTVEMVVGVLRISANGQAKDIDVAPILNTTEGRTYLPARYIADGLGFEVGWDPTTETVLCWPKGEPKPDVSAVMQRAVEERARLEGRPVPVTAPPGYKVTSVGYVVPESTRMKIEDKSVGVNLELVINLPHSESEKEWVLKNKPEWLITPEITETQFRQAEEILARKHGKEIAKAVVDYARQKTNKEYRLEWKNFPLPEGGEITVISKYNTPHITVQVWRV